MQRLWIKPFGEGDYFICIDRDSAKAVHVAFNIILEVAIRDRTQKWHPGMSKRTAVSCQAYGRWSRCDVRFGSKADIEAPPPDVRFTPNSGHRRAPLGCPLSARSGHRIACDDPVFLEVFQLKAHHGRGAGTR